MREILGGAVGVRCVCVGCVWREVSVGGAFLLGASDETSLL